MSLTNEKKLVTFDNIQHYHNNLSQVVDAKQDSLVSGSNIKTINGQSIVGSGDITISGGSSDANVQAVDTGDVLDDVTVNYATTSYVDGLVGDINSVLESIISGGTQQKIVNNITMTCSETEPESWSCKFISEYPITSTIELSVYGETGHLYPTTNSISSVYIRNVMSVSPITISNVTMTPTEDDTYIYKLVQG